jgi:hypothetical protein
MVALERSGAAIVVIRLSAAPGHRLSLVAGGGSIWQIIVIHHYYNELKTSLFLYDSGRSFRHFRFASVLVRGASWGCD